MFPKCIPGLSPRIRLLTYISVVLLTGGLVASCAHTSADLRAPANGQTENAKENLKVVRSHPDRASGVVQLTGKDLVLGQKEFPHRTPADPTPFVNSQTGELLIYGTQVDGTGFSYLKYPNKAEMLRGAEGQLVASNVYLPNHKMMKGAEAIWDTYRLPYAVLLQAFPKATLERSYRSMGIPQGSDLYYGGIALQESAPNLPHSGELGRWTTDNWRRRVHVIAPVKGHMQILATPVFNPIQPGKTEKAYPGFGHLPFLPGDYIGHAYGPNFKLVPTASGMQLWVISEEVTRRVNETGIPAEVTEIVARRMISPFQATSEGKVTLVTVNDKNGQPHPDSDRGEKMAHTKLIEGFRPTSVTPEGLRITKRAERVGGSLRLVDIPVAEQKEYFFLTGSPGNFAGDDYDAILAYREGGAIGTYQIINDRDGVRWKRYLAGIKKAYNLSWAGRGAFLQDDDGAWWLMFHAVDKDLKPYGSYSGVIPANTPEYHRNLYVVPVDFYLNENGEPDMLVAF
jgi:hypothetical protein